MENDSPAVADEKPETGEGTPEAAVSEPVSAPGEILRKAREARGESLVDVVQALKLSYQQLEAIESGQFAALPGPTFVRGFVRNYARHLGLDPEPLLVGLEGQVPKPVNPPRVSNGRANIPAPMVVSSKISSAPTDRSAFPVLLALLALVVAVGAGFFLGWIEMPQKLMGNSSSAAAATEGEGSESGEVFQQVQQELVLPPIAVAAPPVESIQGVTAEALPGAGNASPAASAVAPPAVVEPEISTLRFTFSANAWVQVREGSEGNGKLLFVGTGNAGSTRNIRGTPPFSLVVAKANRVVLEYNGKPVDLKPHIANDGIARLILQ
ncbi:MAG: DUF4115 domain-containing protein [Azoarcus sp.]|jgi:cytoskeleton protein RodZ|nr:DUF4115 domain-containing protein [Azoarcus sp.]